MGEKEVSEFNVPLQRFETVGDIAKHSRLYQQLLSTATRENQAPQELAAQVLLVAEQADFISEQIVRYLPQYAVHNTRHLLNVVSWMEKLLPETTLQALSPLECALCLLSVFTHNLSMALSTEEYEKLRPTLFDTRADDIPQRLDYLRFCQDYHSEGLKKIEAWQQEGKQAEADHLIAQILAEYLYRTSLDKGRGRIRYWLARLREETGNARLFRYGFDFTDDLAYIGVSFNQAPSWLREQYTGTSFRRVNGEEAVNFVLPCLLLRAADLLDFDLTRSPRILHRTSGIYEGGEAKEWQSLLAVDGLEFTTDMHERPLVRYIANACPDLPTEKSLRDFVSIINKEIDKTRNELYEHQAVLRDAGDAYHLTLPHVEVHVISDGAYLFREWEFQLEHKAIMSLLMGTELYGNPALCIRELLQNSLDAVELRDLRQKLPRNLRAEPTDDWKPGETGAVWMTWGVDEASGQEFIRVTDNGTGMTDTVIEQYFTHIGKSFYRSPEFERERILLREHGHFATPISQFGIGTLSCFMIADRLKIRTCPGEANDFDRSPLDITLESESSLFGVEPGTRTEQGTEVTIYLKKNEFRLSDDDVTLFDRLRENFGYAAPAPPAADLEEDRDWQPIDAAYVAATNIVWPLFPVHLQRDGSSETITLNDYFHWEHLHPIAVDAVLEKALEWDCQPKRLTDLRWETFDWSDTSENGTGSRIRLIFPACKPAESTKLLPGDNLAPETLCRAEEIASFVETTLSAAERERFLVKSILVRDVASLRNLAPFGASVGSHLWIDLRGKAAPRLNAARDQALLPKDRHAKQEWLSSVQQVFNRFRNATIDAIGENQERGIAWRSLMSWKAPLSAVQGRAQRFSLLNALPPSWEAEQPSAVPSLWRVSQALQEASLAHELKLNHDRDGSLAHVLGALLNRDLCRAHTLDRDGDINRDIARHLAQTPNAELSKALDRAHALDRVRARIRNFHTDKGHPLHIYADLLPYHTLPELFYPSLEASFAPLGILGAQGSLRDRSLVAPGLLELDKTGPAPVPGAFREYDLIFPLTALPHGTLRENCADWGTGEEQRWLRALGILPFLFLGNEDIWKQFASYFEKTFQVDRLFALLPAFSLWDKEFTYWTNEDRETQCLSALWDIPTGRVIWAKGIQSETAIRHIGKSVEELG
jgi:hypothetical protein